MSDGEILAAVIGAIFVGIMALLKQLLPYIVKKANGQAPPEAVDPLNQSGSYPAQPLPADVLKGLAAFLDDQKDRQPATQGDIEAMKQTFTETIGGHGKKIDSIRDLLEEHIVEDRKTFASIRKEFGNERTEETTG